MSLNLILKELPPISMDDFNSKMEIFKNISNVANQWKMKTYLFGSLSLGVFTKDCDLDILCVGTKNFTSALFFKSFFEFLKNTYQNIWVIDAAKVPIIKIVVNETSVDLSFFSMNFSEFPLNYDIYTCEFDAFSCNKSNILGIYGVRVAKKILDIVPNVDNFRVLLFIIKYWAKINGVYSNVLGFLGGISWTIMVAFVCKKYPNCNEYQLFELFFNIFANWDWSESINLVEDNSINCVNSIISIFTPIQPFQNTSLNVLLSSKLVIEEKLKKTNEFILNKKINQIFSEEFFFIYNNYFSFKIKCGHNFWYNLIESKVRNFVHFIEQQSISNVIHVCTKNYCKNDIKYIIIGLKLKDNFKFIDLSEYVKRYKQMIYSLSKCKNLACCNFNIEFFSKNNQKFQNFSKDFIQ